MLIRFVNISLLILILASLATGVYGLFFTANGWMLHLHRIAAWGIVALIPWKAGIVIRSLKRGWDWKRFDRSWMLILSLALAVLAVTSKALSLMWTWRIGPYSLALHQTVIAWHWILALVLMAPFTIHVWRRWPRVKWEDYTSRRGMLRSIGVMAAGVIGWGVAETIAQARATEESPRRVSGSRGMGEFTGNDFPITGEYIPEVNVEEWRLAVKGMVGQPLSLTYDDIRAMPAVEKVATLDCTLGWYTTQRWRGPALADIFAQAQASDEAAGFYMRSVSGYVHIYPMKEAEEIILATHVGDELLSHLHGYPLRAVVPHRRGWFWVKWMDEVGLIAELPDVSTLSA